MSKSNKTIAGYHILMLLSTIDEDFDFRADNIIREYLSDESPFSLNLDQDLEEIINLESTEVEKHFVSKVEDFYDDSTPEEREQFIEVAKKLIRADEDITDSENAFYKILLKTFRAKDQAQA
uniref:TerB family tellurite resistance protein n=1 Tax=Ornithobacterium rhinotracheale TaxID=28251 RepID=UPI0039A6B67C